MNLPRARRAFKVGIFTETLQDLRQNEVADQNGRLIQELVQMVCLRILNAVEIIDPHCEINNQHG